MATAIHHSADYDGVFCGEIARRFIPNVELIGWDFGQPKLPVPIGDFSILDLPPDCLQVMTDGQLERLTWIDHHKSSVEKWKGFNIGGYQIDGVAACRLAWQYFISSNLPTKEQYLARRVNEPLAVRLAGEYDVWDHRDKEEDIDFQFGLDSVPHLEWDALFNDDTYTNYLVELGRGARQCCRKRDADIVRQRSFEIDFEGLKFIGLNTARCNSQTFKAAVKPEHDGCLGFYFNGSVFVVSLYGVPHKPNLDLSAIAVKHGGGGHAQACGFQATTLPWI